MRPVNLPFFLSTTTDGLLNFFKSLKCTHPFFPSTTSNIVSVSKDTKIVQVFEKLINNRILSVPVLNKDGEVVSVFSMLDFVNHFVNNFNEEELKGLNTKKTSEFFFHYTDLKEKKREVLSERTAQVIDKEVQEIQTLDPVYTVEEGTNILEAIKILVQSRAHRVVVVDRKNGKLTGLITQSRLLEFLGTMLNSIKEADNTIKKLDLGVNQVITIHENKIAVSAFKLMKEHKISAVAIVNDEGVLMGNISANDLKLVGYDLAYFSYLSRPVREYLQWINDVELELSPNTSIRSQMFLQQQKKDKNLGLVVCTPENTLSFVIKTLNFYHIHRLYIVDDDRRPIGVISIHDILEKIFKPRL